MTNKSKIQEVFIVTYTDILRLRLKIKIKISDEITFCITCRSVWSQKIMTDKTFLFF